MKIQGENIVVSRKEIDDIIRYPISLKLDEYLSDALCVDIESDQTFIGDFLEWSLADWEHTREEYQLDDNVPRELRCFHAYINHGERLSAREASIILRYSQEEFSEERADLNLLVPSNFARDIAIASILHVASHTEKESEIPVTDDDIHRIVQKLPDAEAARQAWVKAFHNPKVPKPQKEAYWNELGRRESQQAAAESLANAYMLADAYKFSLSGAVKRSLRANRSK